MRTRTYTEDRNEELRFIARFQKIVPGTLMLLDSPRLSYMVTESPRIIKTFSQNQIVYVQTAIPCWNLTEQRAITLYGPPSADPELAIIQFCEKFILRFNAQVITPSELDDQEDSDNL